MGDYLRLSIILGRFFFYAYVIGLIASFLPTLIFALGLPVAFALSLLLSFIPLAAFQGMMPFPLLLLGGLIWKPFPSLTAFAVFLACFLAQGAATWWLYRGLKSGDSRPLLFAIAHHVLVGILLFLASEEQLSCYFILFMPRVPVEWRLYALSLNLIAAALLGVCASKISGRPIPPHELLPDTATMCRWLGGLGYILIAAPPTSSLGESLTAVAWFLIGIETRRWVFKAAGALMMAAALTGTPIPWFLPIAGMPIGAFFLGLATLALGPATLILEIISHFKAARIYGVAWFKRAAWLKMTAMAAAAPWALIAAPTLISSGAQLGKVMLEIGWASSLIIILWIITGLAAALSAAAFFTLPERPMRQSHPYSTGDNSIVIERLHQLHQSSLESPYTSS